jgi:hypothetical protein
MSHAQRKATDFPLYEVGEYSNKLSWNKLMIV